MIRARTLRALVVLMCTSTALVAVSQEESPAPRLAALRDAVDAGRVARGMSILDTIRGDLNCLWIRQIESAFPAAPAGWTTPMPDATDAWAAASARVAEKTYKRGDAAEVRIRVDLFPNSNEKPHAGNIVWIDYVREHRLIDGTAVETRFGGRQAYLAKSESDDGLVVGVMLAHGRTLGIATFGDASREDVLDSFGRVTDVTALERHLWRLSEGAFAPFRSVETLTRLHQLSRFGEAVEMADALREELGLETGRRLERLLPRPPAGWTESEPNISVAGVRRTFERGEGGRVSVWFGWMSAPDVNGRLTAFRDPEKLQPSQSVEQVNSTRVLLDGYRQYGHTYQKALAFFVDGNFQLHAETRDVRREDWLGPLLGGLDPERIEAELAKLLVVRARHRPANDAEPRAPLARASRVVGA